MWAVPTSAVSSCSCGRAKLDPRFAALASLLNLLERLLALVEGIMDPDTLLLKLEVVAERIIAPGELPRYVLPADDSVSNDDCDESEMVDLGRPDVYVSVRAPTPRCGPVPNSFALSEWAPSLAGGLLSILAADSEFLLGLKADDRTPVPAVGPAAIFSATSSATVFGRPESSPDSARSAREVADVMLDSRFRPHSSHPSPPPLAEEERSMSKLPLWLARTAGLAGELGRDELAYSLPGGGDVGGSDICRPSGPHQDAPLTGGRREFSLPDRCRSADAAASPPGLGAL